MSSDSSSVSDSGSRDNDSVSGSSGSMFGEGGVQMKVIFDVREDPAEEVAENSIPTKTRYKWVAPNVRT